MRVCIVVPYYQRQRGILRRALCSVFEQECTATLRIVIVDDSSPVPAAQELETLSIPAHCTIDVIIQANGGPGAARNRGLQAAGADVDYLAFLDSDDIWSSTHLGNALAALTAGFDFYFSDHYQLGQTVGAFERAGRLDPSVHPVIGEFSMLHRFEGDMFGQIVMGNVIGTSTVVYDFPHFSTLRFREDLRKGGEDYLFWIEFARAGARFAFSSECEVRYGDGVNIYTGSGWGTEGHLARIFDEMKYRKYLGSDYVLDSTQRAVVTRHIGVLREAFVKGLLHRLVRWERIPATLLWAYVRLDPASLLSFIPLTWKMATKRKWHAPRSP